MLSTMRFTKPNSAFAVSVSSAMAIVPGCTDSLPITGLYPALSGPVRGGPFFTKLPMALLRWYLPPQMSAELLHAEPQQRRRSAW